MPERVKTLTTRHGPMLALPGDTYMTRCLETYGEFSPGEWALLKQVIKPGMTVVEMGSNIGAHTVAMARACHPGRLYAFEPQRRVFQILCANLVLNDLDNVVAAPDACGDVAGVAVVPTLDYGAADNFGGVALAPPGAAGETVRVVRLDDLQLPGCGLIKADVEGFELLALRGAAQTIARTRPVLYVENDRPRHQRALVRLIADMGYRLYWHTPPLVARDNFNGVSEQIFDRIVSQNMLCIPSESRTTSDLIAIDPEDPHLPPNLGGGARLVGD